MKEFKIVTDSLQNIVSIHEIVDPDQMHQDFSLYTNKEYQILNTKEKDIGQTVFFISQSDIPDVDIKYMGLSGDKASVIEMAQAEKDEIDAKAAYIEALSNDFNGYRYKIEVDFNYLIANFESYKTLIIHVLAKQNIQQDVDDSGQATIYANTFAPGHYEALSVDPAVTITDIQALFPSLFPE